MLYKHSLPETIARMILSDILYCTVPPLRGRWRVVAQQPSCSLYVFSLSTKEID